MTNLLQLTARHFEFGFGLWRMYARPKAFVQSCASEGVINVMRKEWDARQMERAATRLAPRVAPPTTTTVPPLHIYFMTGSKFWYQTLFCAYSIITHAPEANIQPIIYSDGSLLDWQEQQLRRVLPQGHVVSLKEVESKLEDYLPQARFPVLRRYRAHDFFLRKITDIHGCSPAWKLYMDSDMLFFRRPHFLIDWLRTPTRALYMQDARTAYGYPRELLESLAGHPLPERMNAGLCGLQGSSIDWDKLEYWWRTLVEQGGHQYFTEQAMTAMMMAERDPLVAPPADYMIFPSREEVIAPHATMHHYVAESKAFYFRFGWRHTLPAHRRSAASATAVSEAGS